METIRRILLLPAVAVAMIAAARSAADFFTSAPDSVMPLLTQVTRLDMCDYHAAGSTRASSNRLGGYSRVTALSLRLVSYQLTDSATGQMAVLTSGTDTVVAVVTTVRMPMADSEVAFYDTSWRRLPPPSAMPRYEDWLTERGRAEQSRATGMVPFVTAEAVFDSVAETLTFKGGAARYVAPSMREAADSLFRSEIIYRCERGKLVRR